MGSEYQALLVHSKSHSKTSKRRSHFQRGKSYHKKDLSRVICYTCDEEGHYVKTYPNKPNPTKKRKKEDIMLILQRMMNHPRREPDMKVKILQARMNMF